MFSRQLGQVWAAVLLLAAFAEARAVWASTGSSMTLPLMQARMDFENDGAAWVGFRADEGFDSDNFNLSDGYPVSSPGGFHLFLQSGIRAGTRLRFAVELGDWLGTSVQWDFARWDSTKLSLGLSGGLGVTYGLGAELLLAQEIHRARNTLTTAFAALGAQIVTRSVSQTGYDEHHLQPYNSLETSEQALLPRIGIEALHRRFGVSASVGWRAILRAASISELRSPSNYSHSGGGVISWQIFYNFY